MANTLRYGRQGALLFLTVGARDPSDQEWDQWVQVYSNATVEHDVRALLVVSRGGGPNTRQQCQLRTALFERLGREGANIRTAVCGNRPSVHLITRAIGWLMSIPHLRSFRDDERAQALRFLGVPEADHPRILHAVRNCERGEDPC